MKVPTSSRSRAYPKRSSDGFTRKRNGKKKGSSSIEKLGRQLVIDGDFYDPAKWNEGTGWNVGNGKASASAGVGSSLSQETSLLEAGETYRVDVEVGSGAFGTFIVEFTGGTPAQSDTLFGTASFTLVAAAGNDTIAISKDTIFTADVLSLSVRKITG